MWRGQKEGGCGHRVGKRAMFLEFSRHLWPRRQKNISGKEYNAIISIIIVIIIIIFIVVISEFDTVVIGNQAITNACVALTSDACPHVCSHEALCNYFRWPLKILLWLFLEQGKLFGSFDYRVYLKVRGDKELSLLRYYFPYLTELTSFEFDYSKAAPCVRFFLSPGAALIRVNTILFLIIVLRASWHLTLTLSLIGLVV